MLPDPANSMPSCRRLILGFCARLYTQAINQPFIVCVIILVVMFCGVPLSVLRDPYPVMLEPRPPWKNLDHN